MAILKFSRKWLTIRFRCNNCCDCCLCTDTQGFFRATFQAKNIAPCSYLKDGKCSIYLNRPVGCALFPLAVNKTIKGYTVVVKYLRQCGLFKNGKVYFHKTKDSGFNHPQGKPLYIEMKTSLIHLFGEEIYKFVEENIVEHDVKVVCENKKFLDVLSSAELNGKLNTDWRIHSPGVIFNIKTGEMLWTKAKISAV